MRLLLLAAFLAGLTISATGCSSSSSTGGAPKLVNPPDPKVAPPTSNGGKPKANSQ
jgi:hypothetical protein